MKISELKRPDLAYISCGICLEAFQTPEPPDFPSAFDRLDDLMDAHGDAVEKGDTEVAVRLIGQINDAFEIRDQQAREYRLDEAAFQASRDHGDTHSLDEHLSHAQENDIPIACDAPGCKFTAEPTQAGIEQLKQHASEKHG